jgi:hypothetical protein
MTSKMMRVDEIDHDEIMNIAEAHNKSGAEVISFLLRNKEGGVPMPVLQRKRSKPFQQPLYGIPGSVLEQIKPRMPSGRKEGTVIELENLAKGTQVLDDKGYWLQTLESMTGIIAYLGGAPRDGGRLLRIGVWPYLQEVKEFVLAVSEESADVFIPFNIEAQKVLHIIGAGAEEPFEKLYYTAADLFFLWNAGFEIQYKEGL